MNRLLLLFAATTLVACADSATEPTNASLAGSYTLTTFAGHTLPTPSPDGGNITSGSLMISSNGTFTFTEVLTAGTAVVPGTYTISGSTITFRPTDTENGTATATVDDDRLTLTAEDGVRVYKKS
jgi:hypothetical protein